jgi:hypothetical protein
VTLFVVTFFMLLSSAKGVNHGRSTVTAIRGCRGSRSNAARRCAARDAEAIAARLFFALLTLAG